MEDILDLLGEEEKRSYQQKIEEWKEEYFNSVYVIEILGIPYIFRSITKYELEQSEDLYTNEYDRAEYVCRKCVLAPEDIDWLEDVPGFVPETLTEEILDKSGLSWSIDELDSKIDEASSDMNRIDNQMACIIKEAFPDINLEDIPKWPIEKVLWYYARANWVLETLRGVKLERVEEE